VLLNLLAGGFVAMLGGLVVGLPSLRDKGLYLAIATIAASVVLHFVFANWHAVTGGHAGITLVPAEILGLSFDTSFRLYWLFVPITILMVAGAANQYRRKEDPRPAPPWPSTTRAPPSRPPAPWTRQAMWWEAIETRNANTANIGR